MIDGPGPPGTETVAVRVLPASVALMTSGSGATGGILDTQRILLPPPARLPLPPAREPHPASYPDGTTAAALRILNRGRGSPACRFLSGSGPARQRDGYRVAVVPPERLY
jgi:hypothetical protein